MESLERLRFKGDITITARDVRTGEVIRQIRKSNLTVKGMRESVLRLLTQNTTPDDYAATRVYAIYCGTGTTPPTINDTTLEAVSFKKVIETPISVNLASGHFTVQMTMESGEGNGLTYTEVGLCSRGDGTLGGVAEGVLLLARQTHGAIEKTAAMSLEYTWTIQIQL